MTRPISGTVIVLGAGMVGVSSALSLQARGYAVTVIDRKPPGRETSFGNSGVFSRSSVFPINGPGIWRQLPTYLTNRHPAVRWRKSLLRNPAWLLRFLAEANAASAIRRSRALDNLIRPSMDLNRRRIVDAGLTAHLRETGWLKVWRDPPPGVAEAEARALGRFDIRTEVLDPPTIARLEPHAADVFRAGLHIVDSASVDDPGAIVDGFAQMFVRGGGTILHSECRALYATTTGWRVETGIGSHDADNVVVALGPWSADILRPLGYRIPLGFERGYHVHLANPEGAGPRRAIYDVDGGYVVSPMAAGARVTSGVELAARDALPDTSQIDAAAHLARATFGLGKQVEPQPWLGSRPTMPDCLPMIGPLPRHHGLYAAFGHQHIGFSTGAATGEIIAAQIAGTPPPVDATSFAPSRYLA
jgi:D-amino-acid dehydrogenase